MTQKGPRPADSLSSTSDTGLVNSVMVPSTAGDVCCPSIPPSSVSRPVNTSGGITSSVEPPAGRLATIRQSYTGAGISGQTQNLLVAAWRKGTSAAYTSAWGKWDSWCRERKINPVHAPIASILEFLTAEFHAGKAYRTLNDYLSAISSTHPSINSVRVAGHPLVVQSLKGAFNLRPPLPKYSTTWDVDVLLSFIEKLGPNGSLSPKDLSQKLGILLTLTAMHRVSEVVAHDRRFRQFSPEGVSLQLPELIKKTKVGQNLKTSFHASFPNNPNLCVVQCLQEYERRTLSFRGFDPAKPNRLFLSYIRPHKLITSESLSRWIKDVLGRVLIPVFLRPIQ